MQKLVYVLFFVCISSVVFGQTIPEKKQEIKEVDTISITTQDSTAISARGQKQKKKPFRQIRS